MGYVVADLDESISEFVGIHGAGPFFLLEHVPITDATYEGAPARYDHSTAFGAWGPVTVELSVIHTADPPELARRLCPGDPPHIGHVGRIVEDLEGESARLEASGLPVFHTGSAGPVRAIWHDARSTIGHAVELLAATPEVVGFHARVRAAAVGWDGSRPVRRGP